MQMTNLEKNFFELTANELTLLNVILTLLLSNGLNASQLDILGNFICGLGQNILTIQALVGALPGGEIYTIASDPVYTPCASNSMNMNVQREIIRLQEKIERLERMLALHEIQHDPDDNANSDRH